MENEVQKKVDNINKGIENLQTQIEKKADVDTLEKKYSELTEKLEGVVGNDDFKKQQEQLDDISTRLKKLGEHQEKTDKSNFELLGEKMSSEEYLKAVKSADNVPGSRIFGMELKTASGDITTGDVNGGDIRTQHEPGVAKHPWRQTPVWDSLNKGTIGAGRDSVSWWEETDRVDGAAMVAEGSAPGTKTSGEWTKKSLDIKNIAAFTKVQREALEDWEFMRSEVTDLMNNQLPRKLETQVIDGDNTGQNLNGLVNLAKAFSLPSNFEKVYGANYIDAMRAVMTQIMNGDTSDANKRGYMPNMSFVNQGDMMNIRGMKDANNSYIIPPLGSGLTNIDGVQLNPSLDLTADEFLMGDMALPKVYIKRGMQLSFHYENEDDAKNDLVLVIVRMRIAGVKLPTPYKFGFVNGSWANVKNSILKTSG